MTGPTEHVPSSTDAGRGASVPIDRLMRPLQSFARHKLAGGLLLIGAAVIAMVWANSPWAGHYEHLLHVPVAVRFGSWELAKSVAHWVNDGLMGIFFFVVGLEIKREVKAGELSSLRKAALPAFGAVGGMVVPALLYAAVNAGGAGAAGWGIPMATDIAFALGVLALLGDRVPGGLKIFLTALAIVDDIGAVLVIAIFYTDAVALTSLGIGVALLLVAALLNRMGVRSAVAYFLLGTIVWLAFLQSGVHATIAGILMAFAIPARTRVDGARFVAQMDHELGRMRAIGVPEDCRLNTPEQQHVLDVMVDRIEGAGAPLQRLEHLLAPVVTFLVLPVFALANAGVALGDDLASSFQPAVATGVVLGLLVGKQLGITFAAWLAVRLGVAELPSGVGWRQLHGAAVLGGVGFTMALFVADLAFPDPRALDSAKIAILAASTLSGVLGWALIRLAPSRAPSS